MQDKTAAAMVCLQISGCMARESVVNYNTASSGGAAAEAIERKGKITMKIAIPCENSQVLQHFGQSKEFTIYSVEDIKPIENVFCEP